MVVAGGLGAAIVPARAFADSDGGAPKPWGAIPSARQWRWHQREKFAFVHFAINTFTGKEWGFGDEDPALFAPTDFSADQIVGALKAADLRGVILTAKHHDGFCLWPTATTDHSIRRSPYKGGQGDIVGEMAAACRRAGLPFGVYCSPWDRNNADYGRPRYVETYRAQITELCTRYGELFEVWFDGANGGDGYYGGAREARKIDAPRYYDWPSIVAMVRRLQPMACTYDPMGADLRWGGNEDGRAGDPSWPTMPDAPYTTENGNAGVRGGPLWWPAETAVSIRNGWFYHDDEDASVRSPANLVKLFDQSVGRGTNLNLNVPPDRRGRIADHDVAVLKSFGDAMRATFATDLAQGAVAHASAERGAAFTAARVLDGNRESYWSTPDGDTRPTLTLDLPPGRSFDVIRLREYLPLGCRVTRFAVEAERNGRWERLAEHECIAAQRIIRLSAPITARRIRLVILDAPVAPAISEVSLFRSVAPVAVKPPVAAGRPMIDTAGWRIATASAPGAERLLDGNAKTEWEVAAPVPGQPATVTIDFGRVDRLGGFTLLPTRVASSDARPPKGYRAETSIDGRRWRLAGEGEFANIANSLSIQHPRFATAHDARFLRLSFAATALPASRLAIADIGAFRDK